MDTTSNISPDPDQGQQLLQPMRSEAEKFLQALTGSPNSKVSFQSFDDDKDRKNPKLARVLQGTLSEHWGELVLLNEDGAGVFVMVNEGDLKGRSAENVVAPRALFVDDDSGKLDPVTLKVPPSIVVQSKNGCHAYWKLLPGEPIDRFSLAQVALAQKLGTDPSVKDLPRVMRLPGFLHWKDVADPFLVEVIQIINNVYTIDQVLEGFGVSPETENPQRRTSSVSPGVGSRWAQILRDGAVHGTRNATLTKLAGHLFHRL